MTNRIVNITHKIAVSGFIGSLGLIATAHGAYGLDFNFSGFDAGNYTASGTFSINKSTRSNEIDSSSITDWEIKLVDKNSQADFTLYGPGGAFGTHNSDFETSFTNAPITAFANQSMFVFTSDWKISSFEQDLAVANFILEESSTNSISINSVVQETRGVDERLSGKMLPITNRRDDLLPIGSSSVSTLRAPAPTPVPFGPATDTGIATLASLWAISHFRKTIRKNKSNKLNQGL